VVPEDVAAHYLRVLDALLGLVQAGQQAHHLLVQGEERLLHLGGLLQECLLELSQRSAGRWGGGGGHEVSVPGWAASRAVTPLPRLGNGCRGGNRPP
jgi:hypothetical protein